MGLRRGTALLLATVAGVAYAGLEPRLAPVPGAILKAVPATLLALALLLERRRVGSALPGLALAFHAAGDLALEVASRLHGLGAFLLGHLVWVGFLYPRRLPWEQVGGRAKLFLGALGLTGALFVPALVEAAPESWKVPVGLYAAALLLFASLAQLGPFPWPLALGALLFVASDLLLGSSWFGVGLPGFEGAVWPLYVAAQILMAAALLFSATSAGRRAISCGPEQESARDRHEQEGADFTPGSGELRARRARDPVEEREERDRDSGEALSGDEP